ncbi:MAG TPA: hypothetical protein P5330_10875 [Candidatus Competibacteraceae bacterium]|nr:hypothetical protein [Candidatus Competibacteraceae bacterium]
MKNLFERFSSLTGRPLRTVGTCISTDANACTIQYPGGGLARVNGAGTPGQRYFVLDGRLDGEAPALESLEIEV